ncbi:MAG: NusG domain II-containing protein [Lachnospiraceae bacterium]|nr:NusG domain II-containing protein [Lachnospiraceae bacterium]
MNHDKRRSLALLLLVAAVLLVALISGIFLFRGKNAASALPADQLVVIIEAEGKQLYALPLSEDITIPVITKKGTNEVKVEAGRVSVTEADCKNQVCVNTKPISAPGESIICLPHRVVVSVAVRSKEGS